MRVFKANEVDDQRFFKIPKSLFNNSMYEDLTLAAKMVYAILRDRMSLSEENGWINEKNEIFLRYKREKLAEILGCSKPTAIKLMRELMKCGLIIDKKIGLNKANEIYICHVELAPVNKEKCSQIQESRRKLNTFTSRNKKNLPLKVKRVNPNETDINETDINETTSNNVVAELERIGITKSGIAEITSLATDTATLNLISYAKENKLGAGWIRAAARDPAKQPPRPGSEATAVREKEIKRKSIKPPDPDCPMCRGQGGWGEEVPSETLGSKTIWQVCDCIHKC